MPAIHLAAMLHLLPFINVHPDWREILAQQPYCISIKDIGQYTIFSYSQSDSNFNDPIVRECRGCIIRDAGSESMIPVCVPFYKFGNYGESYCPEIDWSTARVQEKVDGSLIKVWHDENEWHVSTSGTIDAFSAPVFTVEGLTFGDLFMEAAKRARLNIVTLDPNMTHMFELTSHYNRIVVPHTEPTIWHIGTRNNRTFEEVEIDIGIRKPRQYSFARLEDCVAAARSLPFSDEGYVVVDAAWNRVKIKSPAYVAAFFLKNNGVITVPRIIDMIRTGELPEFLTYYPEFSDEISKVTEALSRIAELLSNRITELSRQNFETQKDFALAVKDSPFAPFFFQWRKSPELTPQQWLVQMPVSGLTVFVQKYLAKSQ